MAQLKITFPAAGYWSLSVQATGTWTGGPANPACTSCPTCGSCSGSDSKTLNVTVIDLQSVTATYDKIAAGGIGNSAHQTAIVAKVVPPTAGQTINFSITGGGSGIDCSGSCGSAGDPCSSTCLSNAVDAKLSAATATTNSDGIAQVTLTSSNLAGAICSVQGSLGTRTASTSVTFLKPQMESLTYSNPVGPKQTFSVRTRLTIARGTGSIPVPGHTVINTMQSLHLQNPDPTSGKMEINLATTDPADWMCASKCELSQKLQTFAKVSDGMSATSDSDGVVRFKIQLLDENLQLKDVGFMSVATTALSGCSLPEGGASQAGSTQIKEPTIKLTSVECTSDWDQLYSGMFLDQNFDGPKQWGIGALFPQYCWEADPASSHPICHKINTRVAFTLNISVETESEITLVVSGTSSGQSKITFPAQSVTLTNGPNSVEVVSSEGSTLTSLGCLNQGFSWTFATATGTAVAVIGQPDINIYTTINDPASTGDASTVTPHRLLTAYGEWNSAGCETNDCIAKVAAKMMKSLAADFYLERNLIGGNLPQNIWNFRYICGSDGALDYDGVSATGADCVTTATYMRAVLSVLGFDCGPASVLKYRALYNEAGDISRALRADIGSFSVNNILVVRADLYGRPSSGIPETDSWAVAFFDHGGGGNNYEAAAIISTANATYYFPAGTPFVFTDVNQVITVMDTLTWMHKDTWTTPQGIFTKWNSTQYVDQTYSIGNIATVECP